eukprot:1116859-Rhodomonas_salina.2
MTHDTFPSCHAVPAAPCGCRVNAPSMSWPSVRTDITSATTAIAPVRYNMCGPDLGYVATRPDGLGAVQGSGGGSHVCGRFRFPTHAPHDVRSSHSTGTWCWLPVFTISLN